MVLSKITLLCGQPCLASKVPPHCELLHFWQYSDSVVAVQVPAGVLEVLQSHQEGTATERSELDMVQKNSIDKHKYDWGGEDFNRWNLIFEKKVNLAFVDCDAHNPKEDPSPSSSSSHSLSLVYIQKQVHLTLWALLGKRRKEWVVDCDDEGKVR